MSRKVDVKALISHIVKGDGADKCRICMGDTTEGQVYLTDTVMMDQDRSVTLAEVIQMTTGVEVVSDDILPMGLCVTCTETAQASAAFRTLCQQASYEWERTLQLLCNIPEASKCQQTVYLVLNRKSNDTTVINSAHKTDEKLLKSKVKNFKKRITLTNNFKQPQCPDCGKKFQYPQHLFQHLKESTESKRACHVCSEIMSRDALVSHLKETHNRESYACDKCPAIYCSFDQILRHTIKAHSPGACTCGDCGRNFKSIPAYNAHLSVHTTKSCPGCSKLFRNQRCYFHHVKKCCDLNKNREDTVHTKNRTTVEVKNKSDNSRIRVGMRGSADKQCVCDYCGKTYAGKRFVSAHIQIVHLKNTHRHCVYCGKFLASAHMTEHLKRHNHIFTYKCDTCGLVLRTKLGYNQHLRLHTGDKPYKCQYCAESFAASSRRSEHIRRTHKQTEIIFNHACDFCSARFRLPYRLRKHILSMHREKIDTLPPQFKCLECHKSFSSNLGLLHHTRKHQQLNIVKKPKLHLESSSRRLEVELLSK